MWTYLETSGQGLALTVNAPHGLTHFTLADITVAVLVEHSEGSFLR